MSPQQCIDWLEHGRPSDAVILKEAKHHFEKPSSEGAIDLKTDLHILAKVLYPRGLIEIEGKADLYKDMIQRLRRF